MLLLLLVSKGSSAAAEASAVDIDRTSGEPGDVVVVGAAAGCGEVELDSGLVEGREGKGPCSGVDKRYVVMLGDIEFVRLLSIAIKFAFSSEVGREADAAAATLVVG